MGIYIHKLRDKFGNSDEKGNNPFDYTYDEFGNNLSNYIPTYDWFDDVGRKNIGFWIEEAAKSVGR
ncbi:MAG: hypothetical protein ACTSXK_05115 [Promethearchaeota archaeon]